MKRIGMILSLLLVLFSSSFVGAAPSGGVSVEGVALSELPWSTVSAVLKRVAEQGTYSYEQLVVWYHQGLVTVEAYDGGGYIVKIYNADGIADITIYEGW